MCTYDKIRGFIKLTFNMAHPLNLRSLARNSPNQKKNKLYFISAWTILFKSDYCLKRVIQVVEETCLDIQRTLFPVPESFDFLINQHHVLNQF